MAVTRISELTQITTPTNDDLLIINDGNQTKSISYGNIRSQLSDDILTGDLTFSGDIQNIGTVTFTGDVVVSGSISFLGDVGGIEIGELVDVDTSSQAPTLDQVLTWTSNNRWEPRDVSGVGNVESVNSKTGVVVLDADDIDDTSTTNKFITASQSALISSAVQPGDNVSGLNNDANYISSGDNISSLNNDSNFINAAGAPVQSVNGFTGFVNLDADDIDDTSTTNKFATSTQLGLAETAVQPTDSINSLADVDTVTVAPEVGTSLSWDGSNWIPSTGVTTEWEVSTSGSTAYLFSGPGLDGTEQNPNIYLVRGQKYRFKKDEVGHPFAIQSTTGTGGVLYNDGITDNELQDGTLTWEVQMDSPNTLYYQCRSHSAMVGTIYVLDQSVSSVFNTDLVVNANGTFSGEVKVEGASTPTGEWSGISRYGSLLIGTTSESVSDAKVSIDSSSGLITSTGSAIFAGDVQSGGNPYGGSPSPGARLDAGGALVAARGSGDVFTGKNTNTGAITSEIGFDGSATFSAVTSLSSSGAKNVLNGDGFYQFETDGTTNTAYITKEGSALFASNVTIANTVAVKGPVGANSNLHGLIEILGGGTSNPSTVFDVYDSGASRITFKGDGSATFAGQLEIGDGGGSTDTGMKFNPAGYIHITRDNGNTDTFLRGYRKDTGAEVVTINADGSATFAGRIDVNSNSLTQTGIRVNDFGVLQIRKDGSTTRALEIYQDGNAESNINASISNDGSATFASTVKTEGNDSYFTVDRTGSLSSTAALYLGFTDGDQKFKVGADGSATFKNSTNFAGVNGGSAVFYGGDNTTTDQGSAKFRLNTDGSSTFAGSVTSTPSSGAAFYAYNGGTSSDNAILISNTSDGSGLTTFLKYDGSANFAGKVTSAATNAGDSSSTLVTKGYLEAVGGGNGGSTYWQRTGTTLETINAGDGVSVDGDINIGGYNGSSTTTDGVLLGAGGGVYSQLTSSAAGTGVLWQGMHGSTFTSRITADGEATFGTGITLTADGIVQAERASGHIWQGRTTGNATATSFIAADGKATFASTLTVGGGALNGGADGVSLYPTGGIHATQELGSSTILSGYIEGSSTKNVAIYANGDATFAGKIDAGVDESTFQEGIRINPVNTGASYIAIYGTGSSTNDAFALYNGTDDSYAVQIKHNGNATFAGVVTEKGATIKPTDPSGGIYVRNTTDNDNVATILGDGSATFNRQVVSERYSHSSGLSVNYNGTDYGYALYDQTQLYAGIGLNGSAYFAEPVSIGEIDSGTQGVKLHNGYVEASNSTANYNVFLGELNQVQTSTIKADGSASFASGNFNINKTTDGANFNVRDDSTSAVESIGVYKGGFTTNERTVLINNDGSATFASSGLAIESDGQLTLKKTGDQNVPSLRVLNRGDNQNETISIYPDGSATFAQGNVKISDGLVGSGKVEIYRTDAAADNSSIRDILFGGISSSDIRFTLQSDGSLYLGNSNIGSNVDTDSKIKLKGDGSATFANTITLAGDIKIKGDLANSGDNATLFKNGSASFAGDVTVGDNPTSSATSNGLMFRSSGGVIARRSTGTDNVFAGFVSGNASETSIIKADGSATFAGNVTTGDAGNSTSGNGGTALFTGDTYFAGGSVAVYKTTDAYTKDSILNNAWEGYARDDGTSNTMTLRSSIHANGSATFAGRIDVNSNSLTQTGIRVNDYGVLQIRKDGSTTRALEIYQDGNAEANILASITNDGSADFAGNIDCTGSRIQVGGNPSGGVAAGSSLPNNGAIACARAAGDIWQGFTVGTATPTSTIDYNGGAWFNAGVEARYFYAVTPEGEWNSFINQGASSNKNTVINDGSSDVITFYNDGRATFAGKVECTSLVKSISNSGFQSISVDGGAQNAFRAEDNAGNENITLYSDGSATFKGTVVIGDNVNSYTAPGCYLSQAGYVTASTATGTDPVWQGYNATSTPTSVIKAEGSAYFASGGCDINQQGRVLVKRTDGLNNVQCFEVQNSSSTSTILLNGDGSATFAGQINGTTVGTSDERFKENITPAGSQLEDVTALGGILKNFDWNEDAPVNDEIRATRQLGLIAQEAEEISSSLVKTISRTVTNEEGEEVDDSYKGISHDALVMKLLGAVAEQQAIIEDLQQRLNDAGL